MPTGLPTPQPEVSPPMFPVGDWQFWVVTAIALVAVVWLGRRLLPKRFFRSRRRGAKPATLTISGKPVERAKKRGECH
ncbi:MAG: hypothetical protein Q9O74_00495 [Planctomycetota bacterium]|nr:hypothetical protein [Planctomycetota bacterium]